jgi:hypothetical protein
MGDGYRHDQLGYLDGSSRGCIQRSGAADEGSSTVITPTVGRIVWFTPSALQIAAGVSKQEQPLAAIVTYVWSDHMINIAFWDSHGMPYSATSVPLIQDDEPKPDGFYCEWMPYQKGQAAKYEQLEKEKSNA